MDGIMESAKKQLEEHRRENRVKRVAALIAKRDRLTADLDGVKATILALSKEPLSVKDDESSAFFP